MKINDIILEAPKKKAKSASKKKGSKNLYAPQVIADLDLQEAALKAANKIALFLKTKCQPWLKETNNGKLVVYRGISDRSGLAFTKKTREDRKPKDTDQIRHKAFNAAIAAAGGVANRENALFCTGDRSTAGSYGKSYVLIPVGKFNYTWAIDWNDWTNDVNMDDLRELLLPAPKKVVDNTELKKKLQAKVEVYKKKVATLAETDWAKQIKKYEGYITTYRRNIDKEKAKAKPNKWRLQNLGDEIRYYTKQINNLKTPNGKKKWINERIKSKLAYADTGPVAELRKLERNEKEAGRRPEKDALDPKNYDPKLASEQILADQKLKDAITSEMEIMISCAAGLYIEPTFYSRFVLPTLHKKKVTAKYDPNDNDDDYDDYW
jgi:hypothetical protein